MIRAEAFRFDLINRLSLVSDTLDRGASRRFIFSLKAGRQNVD